MPLTDLSWCHMKQKSSPAVPFLKSWLSLWSIINWQFFKPLSFGVIFFFLMRQQTIKIGSYSYFLPLLRSKFLASEHWGRSLSIGCVWPELWTTCYIRTKLTSLNSRRGTTYYFLSTLQVSRGSINIFQVTFSSVLKWEADTYGGKGGNSF